MWVGLVSAKNCEPLHNPQHRQCQALWCLFTRCWGWGWRMFVIKSISVTGLYTTAAVTFMYVLKHHRDLKPMAINNMIVYCLVIHHSFWPQMDREEGVYFWTEKVSLGACMSQYHEVGSELSFLHLVQNLNGPDPVPNLNKTSEYFDPNSLKGRVTSGFVALAEYKYIPCTYKNWFLLRLTNQYVVDDKCSSYETAFDN